MARVELAPEIFDDFDRFLHHMAQFDVEDSSGRIDELMQAMQILTHSPLIGRPVQDGKRELVIVQGSRSYIVLYRFFPSIDVVFVLALRSQRESGYKHEH